MCIRSIRLTLPFCDTSQENQTKCSLILRTIAVGLGAIALLVGALILCGIPGLSTLGTAAGWSFCAIGFIALIAGACLRCIKEPTKVSRLNENNTISKDLIKTKEFIQDDCFSIKAILFPRRAIHRESQAKYVNKFASLQEKFLKLLKLNDMSALEKRFQELYNDKEMHTDIVFYTKAINEVWVDEYVLKTMWFFYCKDEELFDVPLSKLTVFDTNQKKVLGHRISMTRGLREEQWKQSWASSPPKEGTIGSLFASDPEAFKFKNLIQE